ncbi:MAG: hypothetical protein ABIG60_00045 [Patescibacteria group bacterium]
MAVLAVIEHEHKFYPLIRIGEVKIPEGDGLIFKVSSEDNTPDELVKLIVCAEDLARKKFKIKVEYLQ